MTELTASFLTLARSVFPAPARHDPLERSASAAYAGFAGIGLSHTDLPCHHLTGLPCRVTEVEWLNLSAPDWRALDHLMRAADALGTVDRLHCGSSSPRTGHEARALKRAAEVASDHGLRVAVEPVAFGGITTLAGCADLINDAGAPARTGLLYDVWHVWRALGELPVINPADITALQICGSRPPTRDTLADAMDRALPGAGTDSAEVAQFIEATMAAGYAGPVAVESPSARMRSPGITCQQAARAAHDTGMKVLNNAVRLPV